MPSGKRPIDCAVSTGFAGSVVDQLRKIETRNELSCLMESVTREIGFRYFALFHHDDLRIAKPGRVDIRHYPAAIVDRLIGQKQYRRDPVVRGCLFAGGAFLWSDLHKIIPLDQRDHHNLEFGRREGLNEGISVPFTRLGDIPGSCTFAGADHPERAERYVGFTQLVGVFAFQVACRLEDAGRPMVRAPRLHPRPRDCVVLAGRGLSNKEIARELELAPRTVDGYLTEARRLFNAHDRTELVVSAVLAGEVGLHELGHRQPE